MSEMVVYSPQADMRLAAPQRLLSRRIFPNDKIIDLFDAYLTACNFSKNTRLQYGFHARQFANFLGEKSFRSVTKADFRAFQRTLYERNLKSGTLQAYLFSLRSLFHCLELGDQVLTSVPRQILTRKLPTRLPYAKSEEEISRIIDAALSVRDRAVLELLYASGIRVSECAALRCDDINLPARTLTVRAGKGGDDRIGFLGRPAVTALKEYFGGRSVGPAFVRRQQRGTVSKKPSGSWWGQWVATDEKGKRILRSGKSIQRYVRLGDFDIPNEERARQAFDAYLVGKLHHAPVEKDTRALTTRQIYRIVVKAAKRAGVTSVHPHTLRHSMATHCLNRGMDIRHVQELLGHTSLVCTQKYLHIATERLQEVHKRCLVRG